MQATFSCLKYKYSLKIIKYKEDQNSEVREIRKKFRIEITQIAIIYLMIMHHCIKENKITN